MKIVFAVAEEVALRPLEETRISAESIVSGAMPAPTARFTLHFDGEKAIELTGAHWTVFEPFLRMAEAEQFLKDAELAHAILRKLCGRSNTEKYLALGGNRMDLNVKNIRLTPEEEMLVSRMMKR